MSSSRLITALLFCAVGAELGAATIDCGAVDVEPIVWGQTFLRADLDLEQQRPPPSDLEAALERMPALVDSAVLMAIACGPEDDLALLHLSLGMWLRNQWGLWSDGGLAEWFDDLGIFHPDDMSSILLHSLRHRLRGEPLGLEAQVAEYREFWRINSHPEKAGCPIHRLRRLVWTGSQPHPTDDSRRIHWFECNRKRELWAYEVDIGFYEPGRELAAGVRRLRHIQGPRRYSGCQVPVDRPFRPNSYDQVFAAEVEDLVAWPPDQGSRVDTPIDESRVPIRSLRLHPVVSWKGVSPEVRSLWADAATHFLAKDIGYSVAIGDVYLFFVDSVTESERVLVRGFCNYDPLNLPPAPESDSWYVKHGRLAPWMTRPKWIRSTVESDP